MLTKIGGLRPEFELLRCFSVCRFGTCVRVGCCRNCVSTRHPSPRWSFIRTNFFWHPARRIVVFCFGTWRTSASSPTRNRRPTESGTADGVASFFFPSFRHGFTAPVTVHALIAILGHPQIDLLPPGRQMFIQRRSGRPPRLRMGTVSDFRLHTVTLGSHSRHGRYSQPIGTFTHCSLH